ncbi:hypothetical protein BC835DRAFT_999225 [Cytidiella melzeri]|nr:hypothetical protein BC835DRAFT_999225 [Cytidiella melzeri]
MNRKAPTPIRSTPSSAPLEAMVAKQQAHIDELVMQNRTSEQIILKLKAEIDIGKHRHDNNLQQIKQQFEQERAEWKQAGDSLQNLWRIAYLRIVTALEKEKADGLKTKEELRLARLARLQRDYQIGMFQAKELESENQIVDLQDHLEDAQWSHEQERLKRVELKIQLQESLGELHEMRSERSQLEKSLTGLRSEHTALIASSHASSSSLERVHLQVEGLESSLAELQEKYAEEERNNSDLLRQLEKYRNLEKQEYEESNNLRKQNIELDTEVQNLKEQVEQYTTLIEERENKYHKRMQEYKESLKEHGVCAIPSTYTFTLFLNMHRMQSKIETMNLSRRIPKLPI